MPELELALLQRGMNERTASRSGCVRCHRTPLVGERVYLAGAETLLCELCRPHEANPPIRSALVHGPEFGHTLKMLEQRAA